MFIMPPGTEQMRVLVWCLLTPNTFAGAGVQDWTRSVEREGDAIRKKPKCWSLTSRTEEWTPPELCLPHCPLSSSQEKWLENNMALGGSSLGSVTLWLPHSLYLLRYPKQVKYIISSSQDDLTCWYCCFPYWHIILFREKWGTSN